MTVNRAPWVYRQCIAGIIAVLGAWLLVTGLWWNSGFFYDIGFVTTVSAAAVYLIARLVESAIMKLSTCVKKRRV